MLKRLSRHWQDEFDVLCTLLANALVVHADETSWSINSVWAFLSEKARVVLFGVHKDAATLEQILDPATFAGMVISDDAAVYANFSQVAKVLGASVAEGDQADAARAEQCRVPPVHRSLAGDLSPGVPRATRRPAWAMRAERPKWAFWTTRFWSCVRLLWALDLPPLEEGPENDYRRLVNEVMRLMLDRQLFTFVTAKAVVQPNGVSQPVAGTNNEAERTLRTPAQARDTGRTNKTAVGARRQTIIVSVLESLRVYLKAFTLKSIVAEMDRWQRAGRSCFRTMLNKLKQPAPAQSPLDKLLPIPDG